MRSVNSNVNLSKKSIIAQVIQQMSTEIDFTEKEINQLYHISVKCKNNFLSQEKLVMTFTYLRGSLFVEAEVSQL